MYSYHTKKMKTSNKNLNIKIFVHIYLEISERMITKLHFGKTIHTEFADLVDTLTTQLKPTAAGIKKTKNFHKVVTNNFHRFYFNDAEHKNHISNFQLRVTTKNAFVIGYSHNNLLLSHQLSYIPEQQNTE